MKEDKEDKLRWCTSCSSTQDTSGGYWKKCNRTKRWVCIHCKKKTSPSFYGKSNALPALR